MDGRVGADLEILFFDMERREDRGGGGSGGSILVEVVVVVKGADMVEGDTPFTETPDWLQSYLETDRDGLLTEFAYEWWE